MMPFSYESAQFRGTIGHAHIGTVFHDFTSSAGYWANGTFVNLHPQGMHGSEGWGISGGQQVGFVMPVLWGNARATLWHGTAESRVDLHPPQYQSSEAAATDGVNQGGIVYTSVGGILAGMWSGSAASFVNMNPPGARGSEIRGMVPGVQVGFAYYPGLLNPRATVWQGTPESAVNINPVGSAWSELRATTGTVHVGGAWWSPGPSAALWLDTSPDNVINLASLLPPGYGSSFATGIVEHEGIYYISGFASYQSRNHAILWVVPAPGTGVLLAAAGVWALRRRR
jgi:hypothetical protein